MFIFYLLVSAFIPLGLQDDGFSVSIQQVHMTIADQQCTDKSSTQCNFSTWNTVVVKKKPQYIQSSKIYTVCQECTPSVSVYNRMY